MQVPFLSIDKIPAEYRDRSPNRIDPMKQRTWGNDIVKKMLNAEQYDKTVVQLTVRNGEAELPDNFKKVIQCGYGEVEYKKEHNRQSIIRYVSQQMQGCDIKVEVKCNKCNKKECSCSTPIIIYEVNEMDLANHPEWMASVNKSFYGYGKFGDRYTPRDSPYYTLMRPAVNNFHDRRQLPDCVVLNTGNEVTYWIEDKKLVINNIKNCKVIMSYHSYKMDDRGWLKVPDIPEVWETIVFQLDENVNYDRWQRSRDPADERIYMATRNLRIQSAADAKRRLAKLEPEKFKALWMNFFGKQVPHYYAEETAYDYVNDTFKTYQ